MQVQSLVFAQKEVAKRRPAILPDIVVVTCPATGHQGHLAVGQPQRKAQALGPVGGGLQGLTNVGPTPTRAGQRQRFNIAQRQRQLLRDVAFPIGQQRSGWRRWVQGIGVDKVADAAAAQLLAVVEKGCGLGRRAHHRPAV